MKSLMERLATGVANYETPDAEISENRIYLELEPGDSAKGEISIKGKNSENVKGVVFSSDSHITFKNNQFNGTNNVVHYMADTKNLDEGQICSGTISVVTTAGDYAIPFAITIKKKEIDSTIGKISSLEDFVKLVKESYDEALILFLSKEFKEFFLYNDSYGYTLYQQVLGNTNRSIALEGFLVGMGLKERNVISLASPIREYTNMTENYGDVISVMRSTWGYVDVDVTVEGDFLYNCKTSITGDDFNGKICEYHYYINAAKLHGGSNHGRITLKTSDETLVYDIVIVNQKNSIDAYINERKSNIGLIKNYLNFRTGVIDGNKWMDEMSSMADERLLHNKRDVVGLLAKAQIAILRNKSEEAVAYLNEISQLVAVHSSKNIEEYCYYLYLKTLYKNNSDFTDDIKEEIKRYFENGHDTWQLLWMLFYMDDRYDENPSLKYTMIKRMFNEGCFSPVMYYEAANVLNKQPELLRVINKFEVQVLNFAAKYNVVGDELSKQAANLFIKEKQFSETNFNIMAKVYEHNSNKQVLECLCTMLINGSKMSNEYHYWFKKGVEAELKITNLYEFYIYTIDKSNYDSLEKSAYKYFGYGTDTLVYDRDYFFANLVSNYSDTDEMYLKYRGDLEKFATEEILKGNNNAHLKLVYERILSKEFVVGDMKDKMPHIINTYEIKVTNNNLRSVVVRHKETTQVQTVGFINNTAYVQLYTKNPVIMFTDNKGRLLSKEEYTIKSMSVGENLGVTGQNMMTKLKALENIMEEPEKNTGKVLEIKEARELTNLSNQFKKKLDEFVVDYYYKGYDESDLDLYLLQLNMVELSKKSRNKVMEILIERNLTEMAYPYVAKYGYQGIKSLLVEKLCIELAEKEEFDNNDLVTEMCGSVFRNGCRNDDVLKYLGKYYQSGSLELYQIFLAIKAKEIDDNTMAERLIAQYIFENSVEDKIYDIYREYLRGSTSSTVRKAFYTYVTYNYFIKKVQCPDIVWEILEQEYTDGLNTPLICSIAFVEVMSKREELSERQIKITKLLIEILAKHNVNFEFYKKFNKWFKIPYNLIDKTIVDFRTNPKHRVEITYQIKTHNGMTKPVTEEMGSVYQGVFTKEIIMFYGEEISYSIREYSDDAPEGKIVTNYSVRITDKDIYNDESRFGMINGIMICKGLGKDEAARELMQSYELCKVAGKNLFKLL